MPAKSGLRVNAFGVGSQGNQLSNFLSRSTQRFAERAKPLLESTLFFLDFSAKNNSLRKFGNPFASMRNVKHFSKDFFFFQEIF